MDLWTIRERLKKKYYWSGVECIQDFQQMICNALVYNIPGSKIVAQTRRLELAFLTKLVGMPKVEVDEAFAPIKQKKGKFIHSITTLD